MPIQHERGSDRPTNSAPGASSPRAGQDLASRQKAPGVNPSPSTGDSSQPPNPIESTLTGDSRRVDSKTPAAVSGVERRTDCSRQRSQRTDAARRKTRRFSRVGALSSLGDPNPRGALESHSRASRRRTRTPASRRSESRSRGLCAKTISNPFASRCWVGAELTLREQVLFTGAVNRSYERRDRLANIDAVRNTGSRRRVQGRFKPSGTFLTQQRPSPA